MKTALLIVFLLSSLVGGKKHRPNKYSVQSEFPCDCPPGLFKCESMHPGECTCIPQYWVCDRDHDCETGNDEENCDLPRCEQGMFACQNKKCINRDWLCDGEDDCEDYSDEINCGQLNCTEVQFQCGDGSCIQQQWVCDGDQDCQDSSDEADCVVKDCRVNDFKCDDGSCVSLRWRCDHDLDCPDGSDEENCPSIDICGPGKFLCESSQECILQQYRCDGDGDCSNWEDEQNCDDMKAKCKPQEFQCLDGLCINLSWKCDGDSDCEDQSDELGCPIVTCAANQFQCDSGRCVRLEWRCDGEYDCSDNSDEYNCDNNRTVDCSENQFQCDNQICIPTSFVCDGKNTCGDNSDELDCNGSEMRCMDSNGGCSHHCSDTEAGVVCSCREGFTLENRKQCIDVDECQITGRCSQKCENTAGSFLCQCVDGYILKPDGRGCKALGDEAYLIFANRVDIRKVQPNKAEYESILGGLQNAIALDYHHDLGLVFWSDVNLDMIKRSFINGSNISEVVTSGLDSPGGIAVDWIHDKLFWTDAGTSKIEVSNLDGSMRKTLLWRDMEKPRAIATHPEKGYIYWTDWGSMPRIESASMDGKERFIVANTSLFWPNGLAVDYAANKLYWVDAKHHVIESADIDGKNRRTILDQGLPHPFAITMFEDELYWTDWHTKSINKVNKFHPNGVIKVKERLHFPMDIHTMHPQRQPLSRNKCRSDNGGCSHLCLPNFHGYSCSCPTGFLLLNDNKTCTGNMRTFLVFSRKTDIRRISFDTEELTDVVVPVSGLKGAVALDWDSQLDYLYWSDVTRNSISHARWDGTGQEDVIDVNLDSPAGLAVDWITNKLYWTDAGLDLIEVANLNGTMRSVLIWKDLDKPRDILVDPIHGYMYWTDWGMPAKVERSGMDGTEREVIVSEDLTWPNGLAMDYEMERLYWIDAGTKTVESINLDGSGRKVLVGVFLSHPFGLTIYQDMIYWTDWETKSIHMANKHDGSGQGVLLSGMDDLMDIHMFHRQRQNVKSGCHTDNGGCSHLCLISPSGGHTCACPTGVLLSQDGLNCHNSMDKFLIVARRRDVRTISLSFDYYVDTLVTVPSMINIMAADVDTRAGKLYWCDNVLDQIFRADLDGTNMETVISIGMDSVEGLVVDSAGGNIYWTDAGKRRIEVATLDGNVRSILAWQNLDKPHSLALLYNSGHLYWTDWGENARIERMDLDGSSRQTIIQDGLGWPNGLVIDRATSRLIWVDVKSSVIECSDLSGYYRRVLVAEVQKPYGLAIFAEHIFWTDWQTASIHMANKQTGRELQPIRRNLDDLMTIHAVEIGSQDENVCGDNADCSHLCLRNAISYSCKCPTGLTLAPDGRTCRSMPSTYLLFAARSSIRRISMDTLDHTDILLPLPDLHNTIALDYHFNDGKIYYTDVFLDVIRQADLNGSNMETVIGQELTTVDGIAVDWVNGNLFWTDTGRDVIEVSRLNGSSRLTLISDELDEPRAIAVFPSKGLLFWTDWGPESPKIERSYMDGTNRKVLVNEHLGWPNGLGIDYEEERLYWADAELDRIESSDLHGESRIILVGQVTHPFGLTLHEDFLYWTDWQMKAILRVNKISGENRTIIQQNIDDLMDIHMVAASRQTGSHLCSIDNGGCSHLCLPHGTTFICACPSFPETYPCIPSSKSIKSDKDINEFEKSDSANQLEESMHSQANGCADRECRPRDDFLLYVILGVTLGIVLPIIVILICFIVCKRSQRRGMTDGSLTFANPTYHPVSRGDDHVAANNIALSRTQHSSNERQSSMHVNSSMEKLNNHEVARLLPAKETNIQAAAQSAAASATNATEVERKYADKNLFKPITETNDLDMLDCSDGNICKDLESSI